MRVYLLCTLDTKGAEAAWVRDQLQAGGLDVCLVDTGCLGESTLTADVSREAVYAAAGAQWEEVRRAADRGAAIRHAAEGARKVVLQAHREGDLAGVLALGGSAGTTIGTAAMRALPLGIPKLMVSTLASGQVRQYVGDKDILMLNSVVDIAGLNRISRRVLSLAAKAMLGMVQVEPDRAASKQERPLIAATMFGVTTPCVQHARDLLEQAGYEVLVFHATGNGGQAMESLIDEGQIAGVLDITTTELADELVGGVLSAGPDRLTAAGRKGIPQVISVGALDMVNFGPPETVPAAFRHRAFYHHNPSVTLMRTTVDECRRLGEEIGRKAAAARGPAVVLLPALGVSAIDAEGQPFEDRAARQALMDAIQQHSGSVPVLVRQEHINDPAFAAAAAEQLLNMLSSRSTTSPAS